MLSFFRKVDLLVNYKTTKISFFRKVDIPVNYKTTRTSFFRKVDVPVNHKTTRTSFFQKIPLYISPFALTLSTSRPLDLLTSRPLDLSTPRPLDLSTSRPLALFFLHFTSAAFFTKVSFPTCILMKYIPVPQEYPELSVPSHSNLYLPFSFCPIAKLRTS